MNKKKSKILTLAFFAFTMTLILSLPCFADFVKSDHMDPIEEIKVYNAYPQNECNRVINITMIDTSGRLLGKMVVNTKYGVEDRLVVNLGGYNITKFESNQGIFETCKLIWTSGTTGGEAESSCFINYYFRTSMSKKELNVTVTYRKWDPVEIEVRHYIEKEKLNYFSKDNYVLHSITDKQSLEYYSNFTVKAKNINGYTLHEGYQSIISEPLCLMGLKGKYLNTPSSPRFYSYTSYPTKWADGMKSFSKYDEAKDGEISYCDQFKVVIEFLYDLKEYTINFDPNGGVGNIASIIKCHGKDAVIPSEVPTRKGYTFKGWGTYDTDITPNYQPGGLYYSDMNITLYAIWEKTEVPSYIVSYNTNGGFEGPLNQKKYQNQPLVLSSIKPSRPYYHFVGWGTYASDTTVDYMPNDVYEGNEPLTLYAIWDRIYSRYLIKFNANGGTNVPSSVIKTEDHDLILPMEIPTKTGYTFLGWSENKNASSPTYYAGGKYTRNKNTTLFAIWTKDAAKTFNISFDANGGSNPPNTIVKTKDVTIYIPEKIPVKDMYSFLGWSDNKSNTVPMYKPSDAFTRNEDITLYAVWKYNPPVYYIIFNANGGVNPPANIRKTYGINVNIPNAIPTRKLYDFMGWSEDSNAKTPTYKPNDIYTQNGNVTLYAVWKKTNYDLSVTHLNVSDANPSKYDTIELSFRLNNFDRENGYNHIPVEIYYGGKLLEKRYVDFVKNGYMNITLKLNVGGSLGKKTIEIRVNWSDRYNETLNFNNSSDIYIEVRGYGYEVSTDPIIPGNNYCEGASVVSSFYIRNDGSLDILPRNNNTVKFSVYYYEGSNKTLIYTDTWKNAVIPSNGTNLVYFKWTVPKGMADKTLYMECKVNSENSFAEQNPNNNISSFTNKVTKKSDSQTPNTRYEEHKPPEYHLSKPPVEKNANSSWTMWVYENNKLVLKKYGIALDSNTPSIRPSVNSTSARFEEGKWVMKSGYGITIDYSCKLNSMQGYLLPESKSFSGISSVYAYFPEFSYNSQDGKYRTLIGNEDKFEFISNPCAKENAKEHFLPIYVDDGEYTVSLKISDIWTPTGMIEGVVNSNSIMISGTMYDDFYVGANN